jgi:hypothetical protein
MGLHPTSLESEASSKLNCKEKTLLSLKIAGLYIGGPAGVRTRDPLIKSQMLYRLSYRPKKGTVAGGHSYLPAKEEFFYRIALCRARANYLFSFDSLKEGHCLSSETCLGYI